jgi:hypothetical protein
MTIPRVDVPLSRRAAVTGLGAGGLALVGRRVAGVSAQTNPDLANHPIVGTWNVLTPGGPALVVFLADGTNIQGLPATLPGPNGVTFVSTQVGTWEPTGERSVHFTGVQLHSDADGTFIGTVTIDGCPEVGEDGQSLYDVESQPFITTRDAVGTVVQQVEGAGAPPVTGSRMGVEAAGFPEGTPEATPES